MKNQIILHKAKTGWMAEYLGPHAVALAKMLGSVIVPTAFTAEADYRVVRHEISKLNPEVDVCVSPQYFD